MDAAREYLGVQHEPGGLVLTRIILSPWASDVAGLAIGAITERLLRLLTGSDDDNPMLSASEAEDRP